MILTTNIDVITTKLQDLLQYVEEHAPDVIAITEVKPKHCSTALTEAEIQIEGYHTPFNNLTGDGRGVCVYVSSKYSVLDLKCTGIEDFTECVWISISVGGEDKVVFGCVYRSPASTYENNRNLENMLRSVSDMNCKHLVIVGDLNYPNINWQDLVSDEREGSDSDLFVECLRDCFLTQHVDKPTRFRGDQKPSILDLILTNEENVVSDVQYLAPVGSSDHCTLLFEYICKVQKTESITKKFKYDKGDYDGMREYLGNQEWNEGFDDLSEQESWNKFSNILEEAMKEFIPIHTSKGNRKRKHQLYMDREGFSLLKRKDRSWEKYLESKDISDYKAYCDTRNVLRSHTRKLRHDFEESISTEIKTNPKAFWKYTQSKTTVRSGVSDLRDSDGNLCNEDESKAEILNDFFCSVFTRENMEDIPELKTKHHGKPLTDIRITEECIHKHLQKLKPGKSAGPDGFHPRVLKEVLSEIVTPLQIIFSKSISSGTLPHQWKMGQVTPIFKKGDRNTPGNYRPVSLTAVLCKVMESIVREHLMEHMMKNNLFCDEQHGFVPGRSCMTQLLTCIDDWTEALDRGEPLDAVYLDFKKAFDTVPHERLIQKLKSYGVDGKVRKWISSFLHDRKQRVSLNGHTSQWSDVTSGIPQGSVLGPILFVIFINDLPDVVSNVVKIFADDTKLYGPVTEQKDRQQIQQDIDRLSDWSDTWQLKFNTSKCSVMHLGHNNPKQVYNMRDNSGVYQHLEPTAIEKDLGVHVDDKLSFHQHVNTSVNKANRVLGIIKRTFTNRSKTIVKRLYTTLVRPTLEYGNAVRTTRYAGDIDRVERVQRRATRLCDEIKNLKYEDRLKAMKLPSMYYRRERGDMIQVYKILNGKDRLDGNKIIPLCENTLTRGHSKKLKKKRARLNVRKYSFGLRVTNSWNSLPESVINSSNINTFKDNLDKFWNYRRYSTRPLACTGGNAPYSIREERVLQA